jgi:hypothetical protein
MSDPEYVETEVPAERTSVRIRTFLARTRPLAGNDVPDYYWDGRQLIEQLALAYEVGTWEELAWTVDECSNVLRYITLVEPVKGTCFCNDPSEVNATCGFHEILFHVIDSIQGVANAKTT